MKKLEKLTREQESDLEVIKNKWLDLFFNSSEIDYVKAIKSIYWLYEFSKLDKPFILFFDSPYECQLAANYLNVKFKGLDLSQVRSQVRSQVESQVGSQVRSQVRSQVESQVWSQVRSQVMSQVKSQVMSQVWSQVMSQVRSQVESQVESQVMSQVRSQVMSQVWSQVESQVMSQVESQVGSQVRSQVMSQVGSQVRSQVMSQVRSQVWSQVRSQVMSQVRSQVWSQVRSQVMSQVKSQVMSQVWSQVESQMNYYNFCSYGSLSDFGWVSFYDYFQNIGIDLNSSNFDNFKAYLESGIYDTIQLNGFCIVSKKPTKINRNLSNQLHSKDSYAIEFGENYKLNYWKGIYVDNKLFDQLVNKEYTFEQWSKEKNEEIKSLVLDFYQDVFGGEFVYRFLSEFLNEIDSYIDKKDDKYLEKTIRGMNIGVYTLFKGKVNNTDIAYVRCYCPSTDRMFFLGVHPDINNAKDAIASLCQVPTKLKDNLISIKRQGEMFSFNFDKSGTDKLKNQNLTKEDYQQVVSLKGDEYFSKLQFEY